MYNLATKSTHYAHRCRAVCMHLSDVKDHDWDSYVSYKLTTLDVVRKADISRYYYAAEAFC